MSGKNSAEFQWTDDDIPPLMEATQNLKVEKDYKGLNWELILGLKAHRQISKKRCFEKYCSCDQASQFSAS